MPKQPAAHLAKVLFEKLLALLCSAIRNSGFGDINWDAELRHQSDAVVEALSTCTQT